MHSNARFIGLVFALLASCASLRAHAATQYVAVDLFDSGTPLTIPMGAFVDGSGPGQVGTIGSFPNVHGYLWRGSAASIMDMTPPGADSSHLLGAYSTATGGEQVGFYSTGGIGHGSLWRGSAASSVDLGTSGAPVAGYDTPSGSRQVGGVGNHAAIWSGSAASMQDFTPAGTVESVLYGGYAFPGGERQFGYASSTGSHSHAYVWSNSAASATDIHPVAPGLADSAVQGGALTPSGLEWLVGWTDSGFTNGTEGGRAILWTGPSWSVVDLTPTGATGAHLTATNGTVIVGGVGGRAAVWNSPNPNDYVDLQQYFPGALRSQTYAVDAMGDIVGDVFMPGGEHGDDHAVVWLAVPEPSGLLLIGAALVLALRRRRSK